MVPAMRESHSPAPERRYGGLMGESTQVDGKLLALLDDPQVRVIVFGLAHVRSVAPSAEAGPPRLAAVVSHLADSAQPHQYRSWLDGDVSSHPMTVDQVRAALGDETVDDVAVYAGSTPDDIAWQLTSVLPTLVDAFSRGGTVVEATEIGQDIRAVIEAADQSAGPFGPQAH